MNRHTDTDETHPQPRQPKNSADSTPPQGEQTSENTSQEDLDAAGIEGEGSYTATHRYNEGLAEHLQTHDVEAEAEAARQALEGDEREELERAEQIGKRGNPQPAQTRDQGPGKRVPATPPPRRTPPKR